MLALEALAVTTHVDVRRGRLRWRGRLQPSPLSLKYVVELEYMAHKRTPSVTVASPALRDEGIRSLPHVYVGDRLCLCYPWQWDGAMLIARTIVPWASEWLLHFELWKATGTWHGGGHEPAVAAA
jgi:hypothetical protein